MDELDHLLSKIEIEDGRPVIERNKAETRELVMRRSESVGREIENRPEIDTKTLSRILSVEISWNMLGDKE